MSAFEGKADITIEANTDSRQVFPRSKGVGRERDGAGHPCYLLAYLQPIFPGDLLLQGRVWLYGLRREHLFLSLLDHNLSPCAPPGSPGFFCRGPIFYPPYFENIFPSGA